MSTSETMSLQVTAPNDGAATFDLFPLRFRFVAREAIHFPRGTAANILRGNFGKLFKLSACAPECVDTRKCERRSDCAYAMLFEPAAAAGEGPSGLREWPRP